jgi:hypothetical protein
MSVKQVTGSGRDTHGDDAFPTPCFLAMALFGLCMGQTVRKCLFVFAGRKIINSRQAQAAHQDQSDVQLRQLQNVGQQKGGHQDQADEARDALQGFHAMFLWINSETSQREERSKRASFW